VEKIDSPSTKYLHRSTVETGTPAAPQRSQRLRQREESRKLCGQATMVARFVRLATRGDHRDRRARFIGSHIVDALCARGKIASPSSTTSTRPPTADRHRGCTRRPIPLGRRIGDAAIWPICWAAAAICHQAAKVGLGVDRASHRTSVERPRDRRDAAGMPPRAGRGRSCSHRRWSCTAKVDTAVPSTAW
jgi:hypothetical protein